MRNYLLAAVAAVALATPALARDGSPYVGVDAGFLLAEDFDQDVTLDDGATSREFDDAFTVDTGRGFDIDVNAGYDFGLFRAEGELGYKRLDVKGIRVNSLIGGEIDFLDDDDFDVSDNGSVWSLIANGLLDMGDENGLERLRRPRYRCRERQVRRRQRCHLCLPGHRRHPLCAVTEHRSRPQVSLLPHRQRRVQR